MMIQLKPEVVLTHTGIETPSLILKFNYSTPSLQQALHALVKWCDEEPTLENENERIYFYYYLNMLKKHGLICYKTPLIELTPFNGSYSYEISAAKTPFHLSRFVLCRPHNTAFLIETPLCAMQAYIDSPEGLNFIYSFLKPKTLEEACECSPHLSTTEVTETLSLLISAKILIAEEEPIALQQWEFHDLLFHSRSRKGRQSAPFGGTFPFKGSIASLPGIKVCHNRLIHDLPKPDKELTFPLERSLQQRKSIREQGEKPINRKQLGEFLYRCAHVKRVFFHGGEELTARPYPGGGARYELELYPVIYRCSDFSQGIYHYHPNTHQLCAISEFNAQAEAFLKDAQQASQKEEYPQILIIIAARFQRVSWKYRSMAYALILKNLGVLLQTMYLMATAMELAPCALGGGNSDLFCQAIGTDYLEETSVGEFMLGSLPH